MRKLALAKWVVAAATILALALGIASTQTSLSFTYSGSAEYSTNKPYTTWLVQSASLYSGTPIMGQFASSTFYAAPPSRGVISLVGAEAKSPEGGYMEGPLIAYYVRNETVDATTVTVTYATSTLVWMWGGRTRSEPPPLLSVELAGPTEGYAPLEAELRLRIEGGISPKYWQLHIPQLNMTYNGTVQGTELTFTVTFTDPGDYDAEAYAQDAAFQEAMDSLKIRVYEAVTTATPLAPATHVTPVTATTTTTTTTEVPPTAIWAPATTCDEQLLILATILAMSAIALAYKASKDLGYGTKLYLPTTILILVSNGILAMQLACSAISLLAAISAPALEALALGMLLKREEAPTIEFEL